MELTFLGGGAESGWPHGTLGVLPDECVVQVLVWVARPRDVLAVALTCRRLYALAHDDHLWHRLFARHVASVVAASTLKRVPKGVAWRDKFIFAAEPGRVLCYSYGCPFALRVVHAGGTSTDTGGGPRPRGRALYLDDFGCVMDSATSFTVESVSSLDRDKRHPVIDGEPLQLRLHLRWAEGPPPAGRWAIEQSRSAPLHHHPPGHDHTLEADRHHQPRQQRLILFDGLVRVRWVPTSASDEAQSSTPATAARPGQRYYLTLAREDGQPLAGSRRVRMADEPALAALFRLQPWDDDTTHRPRENQEEGSSEDDMPYDFGFGLW